MWRGKPWRGAWDKSKENEALPVAISKISVRTETDSGNTRKMETARIWQWIRWKKLWKEGKLKIYEDSKSSDRGNGSIISRNKD